MDNQHPIAMSPRPEAERLPTPSAAVWHGGWAVGMAATGAGVLAMTGAAPVRVLLALVIMALPGIIGAVGRPRLTRPALMTAWSAGAALATCATGGLGGPLAALCLTPALACLALGGSWRAGGGLAVLAVLLCALSSAMGLLPPGPSEPVRGWLTLIALLVAAVAAGGALLVARRRAEDERAALQADFIARQTAAQPAAPVLSTPEAAEPAVAQPAEPEPAAARAFTTPAPEPPTLAEAASDGDLQARLVAAEAARDEAERDRDKAEATAAARARFLANMSHELRTPLNAIMGFSDMMRARMFGELQPKYAEYAELIHESGRHLLDLINDVLDMSKIEAQRYTLSREVFDGREALNAALRLMRVQADDAGVKLRAILPPDAVMIDADKRAIKQIALNLLSNALKFTPKDGTVILNAKAAAGALEIVVADTGKGIAAEDLKRLGQPFEQAGASQDRARGTGLGLSLVDALARLHGGALTLESRLGEGTAATVRLPVLADAASDQDVAQTVAS